MGQWEEWTQCSHSCVDLKNGSYLFPQRFRTRPIAQSSNSEGLSCDHFQSKEVEPCNMKPCPVHGVWREWSQFGPCSVSCGNGTKSRSRTCFGPFYQGNSCLGTNIDIQTCSVENCETCNFGPWTNWTDCTKKCGLGKIEWDIYTLN